MLNKIDCSNVLKDGKIEADHELQISSKHCACWQFDLQQGMAESRQHSGMWVMTSYLKCILHQNNGQMKWIFKWNNDVHEVNFYNIWTEPGARKVWKVAFQLFIRTECQVIVFRQVESLCIRQLMKMNWQACSEYHDVCCDKNCTNKYKCFKDMGIWMQWSHLILQVKNWIDFIARWRHMCYKFVHYRANIYV